MSTARWAPVEAPLRTLHESAKLIRETNNPDQMEFWNLYTWADWCQLVAMILTNEVAANIPVGNVRTTLMIVVCLMLGSEPSEQLAVHLEMDNKQHSSPSVTHTVYTTYSHWGGFKKASIMMRRI